MSEKPYDKMPDFIESVYNLFQSVNRVSRENNDKRLNTISLLIYTYIKKIALDNNVSLNEFVEPKVINLIPIFEYISYNNIDNRSCKALSYNLKVIITIIIMLFYYFVFFSL
jgi:hypothetical protein